MNTALLLLNDGTIFKGTCVGVEGTVIGELCYNTGMTGYQEIFTDPSYFGQIVVNTNVHIGNYGVNTNESESERPKIVGMVCRNFSYKCSRENSSDLLESYFRKHKLVSITNVDTRAIVRHIKKKGSMNALISNDDSNLEVLREKLSLFPEMNGLELVSKVSVKDPYYYGVSDAEYRIAVLDLGIKKSILKRLSERDCYMKVFPCDASFEEMMAFHPDGYLLSNGPGDPEPLKNAQKLVKKIIERNFPLFGICLGHQIIALSQGISTHKMHNGHRGINHPVKNLITGRCEITSQNHGFVVNREEVESSENVEITHIHLNDNTVSGIRIKNKNAFSVQYHPEANPGSNDSSYLFDQFIEIVKRNSKIKMI